MLLRTILTVLQCFAAFAIIGLVLIQRGKGAEAGAGFGAGASGTVFGARGATTALSRATAIFAAIFMLNSLALAYMGTKQAAEPKSILDEASEPAHKTATGKTQSPGPLPAPAPTQTAPIQTAPPAAPQGSPGTPPPK